MERKIEGPCEAQDALVVGRQLDPPASRLFPTPSTRSASATLAKRPRPRQEHGASPGEHLRSTRACSSRTARTGVIGSASSLFRARVPGAPAQDGRRPRWRSRYRQSAAGEDRRDRGTSRSWMARERACSSTISRATQAVRMSVRTSGCARPRYCTAVGQALLAFQPARGHADDAAQRACRRARRKTISNAGRSWRQRSRQPVRAARLCDRRRGARGRSCDASRRRSGTTAGERGGGGRRRRDRRTG